MLEKTARSFVDGVKILFSCAVAESAKFKPRTFFQYFCILVVVQDSLNPRSYLDYEGCLPVSPGIDS